MNNTQGTLSNRERMVELMFHTQVQIMKSRKQNLEMHFYNECLRERNEVASQYVPSQKPKL